MEMEALLAGAGLSEGTLRQVERIRDPRLRALAAVEAAYRGLSEEAAGAYVDEVLAATLPESARRVLTAVAGAVEKYRAIGGEVQLFREDADNGVKLTVRLSR